jgi:UDP:flavonoid glycosyltransferase YjiC (YdhE family)
MPRFGMCVGTDKKQPVLRLCPPMKILGIISSCAGGDWPPLLALASGFARRGHEVKIVCDIGTEPAARAAGLAAICLPEQHSLGIRFNPRLQQIMAGKEKLAGDTPNPLAEWGLAALPRVQRALGYWQPALVLGSLFCQHLAERVAATCSGTWCCVNPSFFFGDNTSRPEGSDFSPIGALMYEHWLLPPLRRADIVAHATDALFDAAKPLTSSHLHIGPLFWEMPGHPPPCLLEPGPPWILLSLSTAQQAGDQEIVGRTAQALGDKPYRIVVTLPSPEHIWKLGRLPDNMYISGYLPHSAVLPYCQMMISHAGHGLVLKAMRYKVPMVLIPWGRDQPGVAARAKARGVARIIAKQELSAATLFEAVRHTLSDSAVAECARCESLRLAACNALSLAWSRLEAFGGQ